jgi:hypothetical protein
MLIPFQLRKYLSQLNVNADKGLSDAEVKKRQQLIWKKRY